MTKRSAIAVLATVALAACGQHPGVHEERFRLAASREAAAGHSTPETTPAGMADGSTDGGRTAFDLAGEAEPPSTDPGSTGPAGEGDPSSRRAGSIRSPGGRGPGPDLPGGAITRSVRIGLGRGVVKDLDGDAVPDTGSLVVVLRGNGPLFTCPLWGRGYYTSSFGAYRPGPPAHPHAGNDIVAPYGTPILAPFDGRAEAVTSILGGLGVKVFGADGYVYNAHLSAYGELGDVDVGDVIGFVGNTGNAQFTVPHDHFEWHPAGGPAVDPFPFLNEVCA